MQGFLNLRFKPWLRNLLTRCLAIVPSLIVAIIGGSSGAGQLIIIALMILFPFALVPLLKFTSSKTKMGPHANSLHIAIITWVLRFLIMVINIYFLSTSFVNLRIHNHPSKGRSCIHWNSRIFRHDSLFGWGSIFGFTERQASNLLVAFGGVN